MTEMLSEADNPSFGLMPWVGKCASEYLDEWIDNHCCYFPGERTVYVDAWKLKGAIKEAATHYKSVSQEALDVGSEVHRLIEEFFNESTGRE